MSAECNACGDVFGGEVMPRVEAYAQRLSSQGKYIKVNEASLTDVAIDDQGQPREVPRPTI